MKLPKTNTVNPMYETILSWHKSGITPREMARMLGLSRATIYYYMQKLGINAGKQGWRGDSAGHARAGRIGGATISANAEHMAAIGRRGGRQIVASRGADYMRELGARGGAATAGRTHSNERAIRGRKGGLASAAARRKLQTSLPDQDAA